MIWDQLRRVITEDSKAGRSSVKIDDRAAKVLAVDEAGLAEIWTAALGKGLFDGADRLKTEDVRLEPAAGAVKVRWFTISPENETMSRAEKDVQAAFAFAACGAADARVDTARHPMMHKTETLDVIVLVKGTIDLLLDDGEAKSLKPGDVVIQRATNHAWINRGAETAVLVAVLINGGMETR